MIGAVVGGVCALALLTALMLVIWRRQRRQPGELPNSEKQAAAREVNSLLAKANLPAPAANVDMRNSSCSTPSNSALWVKPFSGSLEAGLPVALGAGGPSVTSLVKVGQAGSAVTGLTGEPWFLKGNTPVTEFHVCPARWMLKPRLLVPTADSMYTART